MNSFKLNLEVGDIHELILVKLQESPFFDDEPHSVKTGSLMRNTQTPFFLHGQQQSLRHKASLLLR